MLYWGATPLLLLGTGLTGYIILSHHTPDLNRLLGRALQFILSTAFIAAILYLGLAAVVTVSRNINQPLSTLIWAILLAIILALVIPPLSKLINRNLSSVIFGTHHRDEKEAIRHFSRSISSALDMQRLGDILTTLMIDTLDVERGIVFINERGDSAGGIIDTTFNHPD